MIQTPPSLHPHTAAERYPSSVTTGNSNHHNNTQSNTIQYSTV